MTEKLCLVTKVCLDPDAKKPFADWQAEFNAILAKYPGYVSVEILSPSVHSRPEWVLVQRFLTAKDLTFWQQSAERKALFDKLKPLFAKGDGEPLKEEATAEIKSGSVTEVFITQITPEKENEYREWIAKLHQLETKFPGFRGVYMQTPSSSTSHNWLTFLQFDSMENLDRWLTSKERAEVLKESESRSLISSLESHRVVSAYSGWFSSIYQGGEAPASWKQSMVVLLVLFPIVMLELKFLNPFLHHLNVSPATFIGNAISVFLIAWPSMPIAIWFLGWWLAPEKHLRLQKTILGIVIVLILYLLQIFIFWGFL